MNREDAEPQFRAFLAEYQEVRERVRVDTQRRDVLRRLLVDYAELFPEFKQFLTPTPEAGTPVVAHAGVATVTTPAHGAPVGDRPRGQEAVRRAMSEFPGRWFTVGAMVKELSNRG